MRPAFERAPPQVSSLFAAVLLLALSLAPHEAAAASLSTLRAEGQQVGAELRRRRDAKQLDLAAERRLTQRLGELGVDFIEQSERIQRAGTERANRKALRSTFEALHAPLDAIYQARNARLQSMARAVMDEDGDLEALYETAEWQESQVVAAEALYFLNWLNYYGARLYEGERQRRLLEAAERGFSEFAVGEQGEELLAESLLGRGLCHVELGKQEWARRDFRLVLEAKKVSAERKAKARLALLDSYARSGDVQATLRYSEELLSGKQLARSDVSLVRFYRLQALFDALEGAKGKEAERYRRQASALMSQLRRAGRGWASKVDALMVARIEDPAAWAGKADTPAAQWKLAKMLLSREDHEGAAPLLEQVIASDRKDAASYREEAQYWLGVCHSKAGDYAAAAQALDAALGAPAGEDAKYAANARYLRFKSLEALMAEAPTEELQARYAAALREFLDRHPDHAQVYEARYRLAEYMHARAEFEAAIEQYAQVEGDAEFELRARFGMLQSSFELLRAERDPGRRGALLAAIGQGLESYRAAAAALEAGTVNGDVSLEELGAKVTLLEAVYLSLSPAGGDEEMAAALAGFAERFPEQRELLPQAVRMRLVALRQLGRFEEAQREIERHADALRGEKRYDTLRKLASSFAKASGRSSAEGDRSGAAAAARAALALYEMVNETTGPPGIQQQLTMARLYESIGNLDDAAAVYRAVLETNANAVAALRGLARVAEARQDTAAALRHWAAYTEKLKPGSSRWFRGQYEQARLRLASGDTSGGCKLLSAIRPSLPGLRDTELRAELQALHEQACN